MAIKTQFHGGIYMDFMSFYNEILEEIKAEKEVVILERKNGWYGGYEVNNGEYEQVFNTDARGLFFSVKYYTDKGYSIKCLDETQEAEFMKGRKTLQEYLQEVCHE